MHPVDARLLHIGFGLAGGGDDPEKYDYGNIEERVKELGIEKLVKTKPTDSGDIPDRYVREPRKYLEEIEMKMYEASEAVKKKGVIGGRSLEEVKDAVKFLELFTFYTGQAKALGLNLSLPDDDAELDKLRKIISKTTNELERLNHDLALSKKEQKSVVPTQIPSLIKHIDKEFNDHLSISQKKALSKKVELAKQILTDYSKKLVK